MKTSCGERDLNPGPPGLQRDTPTIASSSCRVLIGAVVNASGCDQEVLGSNPSPNEVFTQLQYIIKYYLCLDLNARL